MFTRLTTLMMIMAIVPASNCFAASTPQIPTVVDSNRMTISPIRKLMAATTAAATLVQFNNTYTHEDWTAHIAIGSLLGSLIPTIVYKTLSVEWDSSLIKEDWRLRTLKSGLLNSYPFHLLCAFCVGGIVSLFTPQKKLLKQ